jgi:putative transposase
MPFVKVYIHLVWSTKDRVPYLKTEDIRQSLWKHIMDNARSKDIFIDFVIVGFLYYMYQLPKALACG